MNVFSVGSEEKISAPVSAPVRVKTMESSGAAQAAGGNSDPDPEKVQRMVEDMQGQLDSMNISLRYSLYGENETKVAVKVVNKDTGEVIREIPPKELQALQAKMNDLVGMIFDEKG